MNVSIESLSMGVQLNTLVCGQAFVLLTSLCRGNRFVYIKTDHDAPAGFVDIVSLNNGIAIPIDCKTLVIPIDVTVVPTHYSALQGTEESTRPFETVLRETIETEYDEIHKRVVDILNGYDDYSTTDRVVDDIIIAIQEVICNGKTS